MEIKKKYRDKLDTILPYMPKTSDLFIRAGWLLKHYDVDFLVWILPQYDESKRNGTFQANFRSWADKGKYSEWKACRDKQESSKDIDAVWEVING